MAAGELGGMAMSKVATAVDALFEEGVLTGEGENARGCARDAVGRGQDGGRTLISSLRSCS